MTIHKFRTINTDTVFYYDNFNNSLLDKDRNLLNRPTELSNDYINWVTERNLDSTKVINKSNKPAMIKIILGHRCNFSCGYCMQVELADPNDGDVRIKEKKKVDVLKENINKYIDLDDIQRIELWGGEIFLYWHEASELMKEFDREGLTFYIPTNGSLIKEKHIEFFKTLKATVAMGISHDGPAHKITRGVDPLEKKVEVFRMMQDAHPKIQFSFNPVISIENCDLFALNKFFTTFLRKHNLKNIPLMYEIIQIYSLEEVRGTSRSYIIKDEKLDEYRKSIKAYLSAHEKQWKEIGGQDGDLLITNLYELYSGSMTFARGMAQQDVLHSGAKCQADQERQLTIDMDGNVRACQNVDKEFNAGHISDLPNAAVTQLNTAKSSGCISCRVRHLCNGGCPIKMHEEIFDINCAVNKIHYGAIQDAGFGMMFNSEVEWLGEDNA